MRLFLVTLTILSLLSCGTDTEKNPVIKLEAEVIAVHDTAMAKMDVIYKTKRKLKELKAQMEDTTSTVLIDSAIFMLGDADEGMMQWMREYKLQGDTARAEKAIPYLKEEKKKILVVAEEIDESIAFGKEILADEK